MQRTVRAASQILLGLALFFGGLQESCGEPQKVDAKLGSGTYQKCWQSPDCPSGVCCQEIQR